MKTKNNIFEDLARVSTNVATLAFESAKTVQEGLNSKAQNIAKKADLVARDEFDVIKSVASKIKLENESIIKDISDYKKQIQTLTSNMDLLKEQVSKAISSFSKNDEDKKIIENLKKSNDEILAKFKKLEELSFTQNKEIKAQNKIIEDLTKNIQKNNAEFEALKKQNSEALVSKSEKADKPKAEKQKPEKTKLENKTEEAQDSLFS
jgi:BMFP domain-containing protein YqiC